MPKRGGTETARRPKILSWAWQPGSPSFQRGGVGGAAAEEAELGVPAQLPDIQAGLGGDGAAANMSKFGGVGAPGEVGTAADLTGFGAGPYRSPKEETPIEN